MAKVSSVEAYIESNKHFAEALLMLREIVTKTNLEESIKWSAPTYSLKGKNILSIAAFKNHFCLWFFQGVFLKDEHKLLMNAQEKTKALRQMRFSSIEEIEPHIILDYIKEAIENQKLGKEIKPVKTTKKEVIIPAELKAVFNANTILKDAFKALSPAKQREYCEHIATAKREATKQSRITKITPLIIKGVGLHDKYKNC
ncbi:YdeI/OmpD-associated family protein [Lacinutrix sp. C3R15]|uniref:YdeI/OmpD-associated family protein n=1 Tax=Flavobacteriaceae TaxID=49546 RepID=UPI001C0877E0|nr:MULTISPECIES: YdeI/OmpD-associated family protein [Flavobacteriaceae]MBU2938967.1 YdeI/OmpD-associated family protein [Lacinutrix sp. C3R15]MDO6622281.1 YdeI/OmpD-associated family protein [Oceanihabitans sp. 1_MG-2023]